MCSAKPSEISNSSSPASHLASVELRPDSSRAPMAGHAESVSIAAILRKMDAYVWRCLFGPQDYMGLHPPLPLRLKTAVRLPWTWFSPATHAQPIFVVGAPRSGTTLVFTMLGLSQDLQSFRQESHWVWERFLPPSRREDLSQVVEPENLTASSRRFIRGCYAAAFGQQRFVDKNPTNSLRVKAIRELFPKSKILCVRRNGPDNVSSMIDAWLSSNSFPGFAVPRVLNIAGYGRQNWVLLLQPGWTEYTNKPIEHVCAHQWLSVNEYLLDAKAELGDENWVDLVYEDLFDNPVATMQRTCELLELDYSPALHEYAQAMHAKVVNTQSKPGIGKWKVRNQAMITRILPLLDPMMSRLGYATERFY